MIGSQFIEKLFNLPKGEVNLLSTANYSIWICVPYVIPAVICIACFIVQAHKLLRKTEVSSDVNKRITITIFYLSGRDLQRFARKLLGSSVAENVGVGSVVSSRKITAETEITLRSV